jgi:hypothetical protein
VEKEEAVNVTPARLNSREYSNRKAGVLYSRNVSCDTELRPQFGWSPASSAFLSNKFQSADATGRRLGTKQFRNPFTDGQGTPKNEHTLCITSACDPSYGDGVAMATLTAMTSEHREQMDERLRAPPQ